MARLGQAWPGAVWLGQVRSGKARQGMGSAIITYFRTR